MRSNQGCYRYHSEFFKGPSWEQQFFSQFTNDLPTSVKTGSVYMFADDTTICCTGVTGKKAIAQLNTALHELYEWCLINRFTPHPGKG